MKEKYVELFNKRLILEVMRIAELSRKTDKTHEDSYRFVGSDSVVGKIIAHLEGDANTKNSPSEVIESIQANPNLNDGGPISSQIIKNLAENAKQLSREATHSVGVRENTFSALDSTKAANNVLNIMKKDRTLGVGPKLPKEKSFENFVQETKDDNLLSSYANLVGACHAVQNYILARRDIPGKNLTKREENNQLTNLRNQLDVNLERFGNIGECFNDSRMIGGKQGTRYGFNEFDSDSIRAIVMYSKELELEIECKALKDPILATSLKEINTTLNEGKYAEVKGASTHYDLLSTIQKIDPIYTQSRQVMPI